MSASLETLDRLLTGSIEVQFESIDQDAFLKPTDIYRFGDALGTQFWMDAIGMAHSDYFKLHNIGAVLTYLDLRAEDAKVMPQEMARVELRSTLGLYPPQGGKPARYGGTDSISIFNPAGEKAGSLAATWLWFHLGNANRKPGTLTEAPPLYEAAQAQLQPPPAVPEVGAGQRANQFRWTRRESDLNKHVNSIAYVQRVENGLADAGLVFRPRRMEIWYQKPAFIGQAMETVIHEEGDRLAMRLTQPESGATCAVSRVSR